MAGLNIFELINQGWIATYPLIIFSVIMVAITAERISALRGIIPSTELVTDLVVPPLAKGDFESARLISSEHKRSVPGEIYSAVLARWKNTSLQEATEQLEEKKFEEIQDMKRNIWVLGTIGSSAPFIGLLGTVVGIIKSFHNMSVMGTGGFSVVAAGISEALVATALGLVVAILAVIAYNYFQTKVAMINTTLKINSAKFLDAYKEGRKINGIREA